jgi:hypothetical protein
MLVNSSGDSLPEIYVGEGESVLTRLKSHSKDAKKEFWEWAVIFVNRAIYPKRGLTQRPHPTY